MLAMQKEDVPIAIEGDGVELRMRKTGGMTTAFVRLRKGVDLGPALVGLPDDLCPCPHWGYLLSGQLRMRTKNGDQTYEAGDAFYWAAGHAPEAIEDCEYVDFSPSEEFAKVIAHIKGEARPTDD